MPTTKSQLFSKIDTFIKTLDTSSISEERKAILTPLIDFIKEKSTNSQDININFICTHNSRRSHLSQIWAQTMAYYFDIKNVFCYSGGTEATALFPMIAETLTKSGFEIKPLSNENNPIYSIKYADNTHPIIAFSKELNNDFNPKSQFAAIMTCDSANEACPFVPGAEKRIPIMFEDPKAFDHTPQQSEKYMERSIQIATEMLFVFSQL